MFNDRGRNDVSSGRDSAEEFASCGRDSAEGFATEGDTRGFNAQLRLTDDPDGSTAHCFLATYQSQALSERAEALRTRSSSAVLAERVRCVAALCIYPGAGGPPCQL